MYKHEFLDVSALFHSTKMFVNVIPVYNFWNYIPVTVEPYKVKKKKASKP